MARDNPYRPFTPDPDQMARAPDISGNEVNGLGETDMRRPRPVYWATDPDQIAHGEMQRWFMQNSPDDPRFTEQRKRRQAAMDRPLPELARSRLEQGADAWLAALQAFCVPGLAEKVGVARLQDDWLYEGQATAFLRIVVIGVQHDYAVLSHAPEIEAGGEVMRQYTRAVEAAMAVAGWLRRQGWEAEPVTGPMTGKLALIPPALASGFGELGKHGSVIDRDMGASFRLSAVLTDAPIRETPAVEHGIDAFCLSCRICEDACPPEALSPTKRRVRGVEKWYVDFDRCIPFFNQHQGCAICIAVCPWSRPGVGQNLARKLARRAQRQARADQT